MIPETKFRGFANIDLYLASKICLGIINSPRTTTLGSFGKFKSFVDRLFDKTIFEILNLDNVENIHNTITSSQKIIEEIQESSHKSIGEPEKQKSRKSLKTSKRRSFRRTFRKKIIKN
jgi:hypothetical protein